jgi:hypothetical protein
MTADASLSTYGRLALNMSGAGSFEGSKQNSGVTPRSLSKTSCGGMGHPSPAMTAPTPQEMVKDESSVPHEFVHADSYHIRSIKHFYISAPKKEWFGMLGFLFDETLLHPHALVYGDGSLDKSKLVDHLSKHQLLVNDYVSPDGNPYEANPDNSGSQEILVTNPKFSNQLGQPIISCVFHMDAPIDSPSSYGLHLSRVDQKASWDSVSVIFVKPKDMNKVAEIEQMYGIKFKEVPFDVPEISMNEKPSWANQSIRGDSWFKSYRRKSSLTFVQ